MPRLLLHGANIEILVTDYQQDMDLHSANAKGAVKLFSIADLTCPTRLPIRRNYSALIKTSIPMSFFGDLVQIYRPQMFSMAASKVASIYSSFTTCSALVDFT